MALMQNGPQGGFRPERGEAGQERDARRERERSQTAAPHPLFEGALILSALCGLSACATAQDVGRAANVTGRAVERVMALPAGEIAAPPPEGDEEQAESQAPSRSEARPGVTSLSAPRLHVAQPGETIEAIAARYGFEAVTLERMNGLVPPYQVRPGDVIVLPNPAVLVREAPRYAPPALAGAAPPPRTVLASRETPAHTPPSAPPPARARARSGPAFYQRPSSGPILARFGAMANGGRLDGVELAAPPGAPILAAADGVVVYAGGDVPAYGNLVLVRHPDGGVTAYGYAGSLSVREGARVRRGDTLGQAGERGRIFFQVRRGASAIDPAPLIGD
jgi:LysM repeat protein